jgi:O-antigen/teichoic acid export membrane protein
MNWKSLIPKGKFAKNVGVLAGGTAFAQALLVLSTPILTRIFTPEDFGVYSVYLALLSILVVIASFLYEMAIPLPEKKVDAANVLMLCIILVFTMAIIHFVILTSFSLSIAALLNTPSLSEFLWLIPIAFLGGGIFQAVHYWSIRNETFFAVSLTKLSQSTSQILLQVILGLMKFVKSGLLIGDAIGRVVAGVTISILALRHEKEVLKQVTWEGIKSAAKRYKRFPLLSSGSSLLNSLSLQLPALLLTAFFGPYVVGLYVLAQRILGLPVAIIGGAVSEVYLSEASKIEKTDMASFRTLFWKSVKSMGLIALVFIIGISTIAPPLFSVIFGEEWHEAGVYLQLLAVMYFFQFVSAPIGANIPVFERQDFHLYREIIRILLLSTALFLASWYEVSATVAIFMLSISGTIGYIIHSFFSWRAMEQHFKNQQRKEGE